MENPGHASPADSLTIGEVIRRTGLPASTLHYYERKGLIYTERSGGNQRIFTRRMLRRISLIIAAKRFGIPLTDISEMFATLPTDHSPSHDDWQRLSRDWKKQLEIRRHAIEKLEHELTGCIGCGCLSMRACRILNPEDTLRTRGPGPVRLQSQTPPHTQRQI